MYIYNYRIFDRYQVEVISLALLTDTNSGYRPNQYQHKRWGFELTCRFPAIKLLDYSRDWEALESNSNPIAIVVIAFLKAQQEKSGQGQFDWKLKLVRLLYARQYNREQVIQLFEFIDWALNLPKELELVFREEVNKLEVTNKVAYVTSIERIGVEKGLEQGLHEGTLALILRQLKRRFGELDVNLEQQVNKLPLEKLETLGDSLLDFSVESELTTWLEQNQ